MSTPNPYLGPLPRLTERALQLAHHSTPYRDPISRISWERLSTNSYWIPESAISLYGLPEYKALPLALRQRLSQYEFAYFLEAGVWLEGIFLERLARAAADSYAPRANLMYHLHELRE